MVEAFWGYDGRRGVLSGAGTEAGFEGKVAKPGLKVRGICGLRPDRDGIWYHLFDLSL